MSTQRTRERCGPVFLKKLTANYKVRVTGEIFYQLLIYFYVISGSYNHLNAGMAMSAMVDCTGGFPHRLTGTRNLMALSGGTLFTDLMEMLEK